MKDDLGALEAESMNMQMMYIHLFIHSLHKYLLDIHSMPGSVSGTGDEASNYLSGFCLCGASRPDEGDGP